MLEEAEDERIHGRPVLGPTLHVGGALRVVQPAGRAVVGAGEGAAEPVELEAEGVAAAFREDLEDLCSRVVTPDALSEKFDSLDIQIRGAALGAVDPAVRTPVQVGREGMGILEPE
ncbi:MAG: hypothetical protein EBY93_05360, partial [Actinobacteria bacterium]|nr:hypothetical protein [Actinomycetota bacterium]